MILTMIHRAAAADVLALAFLVLLNILRLRRQRAELGDKQRRERLSLDGHAPEFPIDRVDPYQNVAEEMAIRERRHAAWDEFMAAPVGSRQAKLAYWRWHRLAQLDAQAIDRAVKAVRA